MPKLKGNILAGEALRKMRLQKATMLAADWLARGNELEESGQKELAERAFEKAQTYQDQMNALLRNN